MYQLKSLQISNNCFALSRAETIKFGVRVPANNNAKLRSKIQEEVENIIRLGKENNASEQDINEQLEKLDNSFLSQFEQIDYSLTKEIGNETITGIYLVIDGKETHVPMPIQGVLSFLYENGIIK